ncbi:activating signal cointegrator 1 complex subunit 3 [Galendromus occidentalis]|uniref:Activating signal cointegrator 1 complex subunit 3 n=1 Tax=Galendromus occidentalis TaxID=34638 RepID=A0AAJ7SHD6_9ACAR|nr:activating signal cointegrator 1 complex subunit 3 [Galendromus occidentalis]
MQNAPFCDRQVDMDFLRRSPAEHLRRRLGPLRSEPNFYKLGLADQPDFLREKSENILECSDRKASADWQRLKDLLVAHRKGVPESTILDLIRTFQTLCQEALGDVQEGLCHAAALKLLSIFVDHAGGYLRDQDVVKVRCCVAPIPKDVLTKIMEHVSILEDFCGEYLSTAVNEIAENSNDSNAFLKETAEVKLPIVRDPEWLEREFLLIAKTPMESSKSRLGFDEIVKQTNIQSGKDETPTETYNEAWLQRKVRDITRDLTPSVPPEEIVKIIVNRLESASSDDVVSSELFEALGMDFLELISEVMKRRKDIMKAVARQAHIDSIGASGARQKQMPSSQSSNPLGQTVSVNLESEILLQKKLSKEEKKLHKLKSNAIDDLTIDELRQIRQQELTERYRSPTGVYVSSSSKVDNSSMPHVYDSLSQLRTSKTFVGGLNLMLPESAKQITTGTYDEIRIPVSDSTIPRVCTLISIMDLEEPLQAAFPKTERLNLIQSAVYPVAYQSNENMLICAPTGAGKTNVAMLTIMREVMKRLDPVTGRASNDFKIVYVAPMKALASEMVSNFGSRLSVFGMSVRELTGDMQLTKTEMMKTHMLVTTPEKWDVVTRKGSGDVQMVKMVTLLILDEVHLLHGDRGPVLEALVARTIRQVESTQSMIRIIGLSATLPNYTDVANFLGVNLASGLFYFDHRFRPVPLAQTFVGYKGRSRLEQNQQMNDITYEKALEIVKAGNQVMVFVHSRNNTIRSAGAMRDIASEHGKLEFFLQNNHPQYSLLEKNLASSRNKKLQELFRVGFGFHHAGMLRQDRNFVEKAFSKGAISVLFCTSTLAWGVNLPANCVIIKGTDVYDSTHGAFVDLGILDVLQIFGRAGRPQFQQTGEAMIITHHSKMSNYVSLMTNQWPIESKFHQNLADNLIAEIVLGTVTNIDEAVEWLSYTYLFVRMKKNPLVYGLTPKSLREDPELFNHRRGLIEEAARKLDSAKMIRYHEATGSLDATDLGRTASHFYIKYETVERINEWFLRKVSTLQDADVIAMISQAQEFDQLQMREDESEELIKMERRCELVVKQGVQGGKINTLIQNYISRGDVETFSLVSDSNYIVQNATRIGRALFEMALRKGNALAAGRLLLNSKMLERQSWYFNSPLRQFPGVSYKTIEFLERKDCTLDALRGMDPKEVGQLVQNQGQGALVHQYAHNVPYIEIDCTVHPITRTVFKVTLDIEPAFTWDDNFHHNSEAFWIWIEDPESDHITHSEYFILTKKQVMLKERQNLVFTIPVTDPPPGQYLIHVDSDRWIGSEDEIPMSFKHLILPTRHLPHTELLDLQPLPKTALKNELFESLYPFTHFNPIQTQLFHTLYHTDHNVLLGAPTGSGKTIVAEIAMFRVFQMQQKRRKVVYIAPLKSLVKERVKDWNDRLVQRLGFKMAELTGDVTPDFRTIAEADIIVTTPEKWDGVSRSWQTRCYVQDVALIVIDEIHLLGEDRGPVLEVIVSRANFIGNFNETKIRIIGLSTALANARDLADWLQIGEVGLFNFKPSVRPVQLEVHVSGHPGKHYCPRMALMNKPTFRAIQQHSPSKPVLIFVSSRRQTRLTANDLIAFLGGTPDSKVWLNMDEASMEQVLQQVNDQYLRHSLNFGVGMHHAGLQEKDRQIVEELFLNCKIQVLIATSTLAWGVNLPAHLVVVKGTEYFDAKVNRYSDYPITDVLQMIGRAGRPQFDTHGVAVVMVHDQKKKFYQKFLYEPFPVESSLLKVLPDHINAEIVAGTLTTTQDCMEYMTWTYFFRRLLQNPSYYDLEDVASAEVNKYLSDLIARTIDTLIRSYCVELDEDDRTLIPTPLAKIISFYYLYHETAKFFHESLNKDCNYLRLMELTCECKEFAELPVRHNEDLENAELAENLRWGRHRRNYDSPHTKAFLLLQAHMERCPMPSSDYLLDLKSMLDQVPRVIQAEIDILSAKGLLSPVLSCILLLQTLNQARYHDIDDPLTCLPEVEDSHLYMFRKAGFDSLAEAVTKIRDREMFSKLQQSLRLEFSAEITKKILFAIKDLPLIKTRLFIDGPDCQGVQIPVERFQGAVPDRAWIRVKSQTEYTISFETTRQNSMPSQRGVPKAAIQSRKVKAKDEGWFFVIGSKESGTLTMLKRCSGFYQTMTYQSTFMTPETPTRMILTVFLLSDVYLGLDQEYNVYLDVSN